MEFKEFSQIIEKNFEKLTKKDLFEIDVEKNLKS